MASSPSCEVNHLCYHLPATSIHTSCRRDIAVLARPHKLAQARPSIHPPALPPHTFACRPSHPYYCHPTHAPASVSTKHDFLKQLVHLHIVLYLPMPWLIHTLPFSTTEAGGNRYEAGGCNANKGYWERCQARGHAGRP